jgi:hypothetical protein
LKEWYEAAVSILVEVELVQGLVPDFNVLVGDGQSRHVLQRLEIAPDLTDTDDKAFKLKLGYPQS